MNATQQVLNCLAQLLYARTTRINWISDGSASKVVENASCRSVECSVRGIRIVVELHDGSTRNVSWRMSKADASTLVALFNNTNIYVDTWGCIGSFYNAPNGRNYATYVAHIADSRQRMLMADYNNAVAFAQSVPVAWFAV